LPPSPTSIASTVSPLLPSIRLGRPFCVRCAVRLSAGGGRNRRRACSRGWLPPGRDLAGLRDRALLLLAAGTGLGRAALVNLDMEHIRFTTAGLELSISR
jgi:hypothetical protein